MKFKKWLENWDMTSLKVNAVIMEMEWKPQEKDREAAWELYIEMLTRIATQPLPDMHGDEQTALESVASLFGITREILRRKGRDCVQFSKIAVIVLNQVIRPFTAKWHRLSLKGQLKTPKGKQKFRSELKFLQRDLWKYTRALAEISDVEDLTTLASESK